MSQLARRQRYLVKETAWAIEQKVTVTDEAGTPAFEIDGSSFIMHQSFAIKNTSGEELYHLKQKALSLKMTKLVLQGDRQVAEVVRQLTLPTETKFAIHVDGGEALDAEGDFLGYRYCITRAGTTVATISRDGVNLLNSYAVEVEPGEEAAFIIACAVAMDRMVAEVHPGPGHLPTI